MVKQKDPGALQVAPGSFEAEYPDHRLIFRTMTQGGRSHSPEPNYDVRLRRFRGLGRASGTKCSSSNNVHM